MHFYTITYILLIYIVIRFCRYNTVAKGVRLFVVEYLRFHLSILHAFLQYTSILWKDDTGRIHRHRQHYQNHLAIKRPKALSHLHLHVDVYFENSI